MSIRKTLFSIARSRPLGCVIGFAAHYFPFLIPAKKIYQDKWVVAFWHPVPSYEQHVVFLPRKWIRSILHMNDGKLFCRLLHAAEVVSASPERKDETLLFCVNAGRRQDVRQLHFHLVSIKDDSGYDVSGPMLQDGDGWILAGSGTRLAMSAGKDLEWKKLFGAAVAFLNTAAQDMDLTREGFSLRILKKPEQNTFEKKVYLDFDRSIIERRTDYESSSHL